MKKRETRYIHILRGFFYALLLVCLSSLPPNRTLQSIPSYLFSLPLLFSLCIDSF